MFVIVIDDDDNGDDDGFPCEEAVEDRMASSSARALARFVASDREMVVSGDWQTARRL